MSNAAILEAQADFALNFLRQMSTKNAESNILSPVSVAVALAMVYAGARRETAEQMAQLLANGAPDTQIHTYFGALLDQIQAGSEHYALEGANKVFVQSGFAVLEGFRALIQTHYEGQFEAVDFAKGAETAKKINDFVENATHNKIHDLITPDMLDDLTRLVLVNAIYFKGNWKIEFEVRHTKKQSFHVAKGVHKQLDMMQSSRRGLLLQLLGMAYQGEEVFMFIVLPKRKFSLTAKVFDKLCGKEKSSLTNVLNKLSGKALIELCMKREKQEIEVTLPKFRLESTHDLNEALEKLGIPNAFNEVEANFEGISVQKPPLFISKVVQKAFIKVNEWGTVAAAETQFPTCGWSGEKPPRVPKFVADHPFACFLASANGHVFFEGIFRG